MSRRIEQPSSNQAGGAEYLAVGLTGDPPEMPKLGVTLHDDYDDLQAEHYGVADRIVGWSEGLTESWLNEPHTFTSQTSGITQVVPR